jgi:hypothetical protein
MLDIDGRIPGDLFRDVCQVGSTHVGIHGSSLVLHRRNREMFIGKLGIGMLGKTLVDCVVDPLTDMTGETLPASACGGGEFLDPFLFQALAQLRLAPPFLAVVLLALSQFAMECPVVLSSAGGDKVGNTRINTDHRGRWRGLHAHDFIRPPPADTPVLPDMGRKQAFLFPGWSEAARAAFSTVTT